MHLITRNVARTVEIIFFGWSSCKVVRRATARQSRACSAQYAGVVNKLPTCTQTDNKGLLKEVKAVGMIATRRICI